jgi:hypothetical protein
MKTRQFPGGLSNRLFDHYIITILAITRLIDILQYGMLYSGKGAQSFFLWLPFHA